MEVFVKSGLDVTVNTESKSQNVQFYLFDTSIFDPDWIDHQKLTSMGLYKIHSVGPDVNKKVLGYYDTFFDFVNTFTYTRRERDIAFGLLSVMMLAFIVLICAFKIDRDELKYVRKLQAKAKRRGYKVD